MSCPICCENFNKSTRQAVPCCASECQSVICKTCARTYIAGLQGEALCMECKTQWPRDHLITHLNASWVGTKYRQALTAQLLDLQRARLPLAQPRARAEEELDAATVGLDQAMHVYIPLRRAAELPNPPPDTLMAYEDAKQLEATAWERYHTARAALDGGDWGAQGAAGPAILMACPKAGCKGSIDAESGECGLCDQHVCTKCLEPRVAGEEHSCQPDALASASRIKSSTKPCPSCGVRISKIDGCDQMWCPCCHKAFSWTRGTIETGHIHNPHFLEYRRQMGLQPRAPGDLVCGGPPTLEESSIVATMLAFWVCNREDPREDPPAFHAAESVRQRIVNHGRLVTFVDCVNGTYCTGRHREFAFQPPHALAFRTLRAWGQLVHVLKELSRWVVPRMQAELAAPDTHQDLSVLHLRNKLSEEELARQLYCRKLARDCSGAVLPILETLTHEGLAIARGLVTFTQEVGIAWELVPRSGYYTDEILDRLRNSDIAPFLQRAEESWTALVAIARRELIKIAKIYKRKVPAPEGDFKYGSFGLGTVSGSSKVVWR